MTAEMAAPSHSGGVPDVGMIFRDHGPFVHTMLASLGVRPSDVDDAFQEVFVVIHRRLSTYERRNTLRSWVYGICVRVAASFRRRAFTSREVVTDDVPEVVDPRTPAEHVGEQEARRILCAILDELDDEKRAVFVLYELEEMPMQEVADALQCPLQTAYSRLSAAREVVAAAIRRRARKESR